MILERLYPTPNASVDGEDRDALLELYRPPAREWLRLNLITSVTGAASGSDGTSETLTNAADRRILGVIRELADVVLVGAESVRAEGYLQPRRSRLAIVTASGDLSGHRLSGHRPDDAAPPIVICTDAAAGKARSTLAGAEIVVVPSVEGRIAPHDIVSTLRGAGLASIVCEGGPGLAAQLVAGGLADEFCLATSARIGGAPFPVLGTQPIAERGVLLTSLLRDEWSSLYARWAISS